MYTRSNNILSQLPGLLAKTKVVSRACRSLLIDTLSWVESVTVWHFLDVCQWTAGPCYLGYSRILRRIAAASVDVSSFKRLILFSLWNIIFTQGFHGGAGNPPALILLICAASVSFPQFFRTWLQPITEGTWLTSKLNYPKWKTSGAIWW
jgi:hypothetical protein